MHRSIEGDPLPVVMYHETRSVYLPEILAQGLEPRDTTKHHYAADWPTDWANAGVEAVYLTAEPAHGWWGHVQLEVDVDGLAIERDPVLNPGGDREGPVRAYRTRERIDPSRIRCVDAVKQRDVTEGIPF